MSSVTTISIEEFEATFKPEANHLVESDKASFCGWMYETYGVEDEPRWPPQTAPLVAGQTAPGRTGWIMTIPG